MIDYAWAESLDGHDWEDEIFLFLQIRHGPTHVQRVPSEDHGDLGLDAFSLADGSVYQCYAPQGAHSLRLRYERHREKITEDIGKFIKRRDRIVAVLGNLKISRWILAVPRNDSRDILAHAATKAQDVRDASLPYVASDFQILVQDAQDFRIERQQAVLRGTQGLDVPVEEVDALGIQQWMANNNPLIVNLRRKLRSIYVDEDSEYLAERIDVLISAYIEGENVLSALSQEHPDMWEKIQGEIKRTERRLKVIGRNAASAPAVTFGRELTDLSGVLQKSGIMVSETTADRISHGKVSDWLLRCPLDFPEVR